MNLTQSMGERGLFFIRLIIKMKRMAMMMMRMMMMVRRRMKIMRMMMMAMTMTMMTVHGDEQVFLNQVFSDILRIHIIE